MISLRSLCHWSLVAITALSSTASAGDFFTPRKTLLATNVMYGVDGPFVGDANPVRGIPGDDLPWEPPAHVVAKLTTDGFLFIAVRGLVLGNDDVVPPDQRLTNPDDTFRGAVSCLTEDEATGTTPPVNVLTKPFKADAHGNSLIIEKLELPNPCVAPIILVLDGDEFAWFAMTGHESE